MKTFTLYLSAALLAVVLTACAEESNDNARDVAAENAAAEKETVNGQELAQTCANCHGAEGVSANSTWPNLADQNSDYLVAQITAFRDGIRKEPTMMPFVKDLSNDEVQALAEHFSGLPHPGNPQAETLNSAGENVRARCISCHGMQGLTVNSEWPNLAGQKQEYLQKQLHAFRDGSRKAPVMQVIANELTDQQIKDVAEYYSQLAY